MSPAGEVVARGVYHEADAVTAELDFELVRRERIHTPLLRDERLDVVIAELDRIWSMRRRGVIPRGGPKPELEVPPGDGEMYA